MRDTQPAPDNGLLRERNVSRKKYTSPDVIGAGLPTRSLAVIPDTLRAVLPR